MSIVLNVRAEDPQVEKLLSILQTQFPFSLEVRVAILEKASRWIRATSPVNYGVAMATITLDLPHADEPVAEQVDIESVLQQE